MAFVQWSQNLSVGVQQIDIQHQKLVQMVNDLYEAMSKGEGDQKIVDIISGLDVYVRTHFRTEEGLMKSKDYPELSQHKAEHDKLTAQVGTLREDLKAGKKIVPVKVAGFLKDWLINHIQKTDKKYAPFLAD
ncbi:MAG: bacteriohemerythrin [Desulfarculaceae bacterium]|jgi:hemerythrin-like metal-binding protein